MDDKQEIPPATSQAPAVDGLLRQGVELWH